MLLRRLNRRLSKENKQVEIRLYFDERGLDRYYGLLELGELGGIWKNVAGRYEIDGKKIYGKQIYAEPEKYFTDDIMKEVRRNCTEDIFHMERIETTILRNLVFNEEFARKTIPFIQPDFFEQRTDKILFEEIVSFITKYDSCATLEALNIEVENRTDLTAEEVKQINDTSKELNDSPVDNQWLLDITEKWCRDRAIYLALMESIHIADG